MDGPGRGGYARLVSPETEAKPSTRRKKGAGTIARSYLEALGRQELDEAVALWKPGARDTLVGLAELRAPEGISSFFGDLFAAFPDGAIEVVSVTAQKDRAAVRWRIRGTFDGSGTFQGMRPNGARIDIEGLDLFTVEDERIVDNVAYMNGAELARQLGALPPQGSLAERGMTGALNAKVAATELIARLRER